MSLIIKIAQNFVRKKLTLSKNFELDFTFLLEASIKGVVLSFKDDMSFKDYKIKRDEINKRLVRIAETAAAVYRKTTGRAKKQLERNAKKISCV